MWRFGSAFGNTPPPLASSFPVRERECKMPLIQFTLCLLYQTWKGRHVRGKAAPTSQCAENVNVDLVADALKRPWGMDMTMKQNQAETQKRSFPRIKADMVKRLTREADLRTIQPQEVDWAEIHRQAAELNAK